jgi:hypothetical protein
LQGKLIAKRRGDNTEIGCTETRTEGGSRQEERLCGANEGARPDVELQRTLTEKDSLRRELLLANSEILKLRSEAEKLREERANPCDENESLGSTANDCLGSELDESRTDHETLLRKYTWVCKEHEALLAEFKTLTASAADSAKREPPAQETARSESHPNGDTEATASVFTPNGTIWEVHVDPTRSVPRPQQRRELFKLPGPASVAGGTASEHAGHGTCPSALELLSPPRAATTVARAANRSPGDSRRAVAQRYLDEPVTKELDKLMQKGVRSFLSSRKRKYCSSEDEKVYYVCQACSVCRSNPKRAMYTSYFAKDRPDHPLHRPGFAAYHLPLPAEAKGQLRRHLRLMREMPDVVVADPPAATVCDGFVGRC